MCVWRMVRHTTFSLADNHYNKNALRGVTEVSEMVEEGYNMRQLAKLSLILIMLASAVSSWAQTAFTVDAPAITALGQPFRVEFTIDAEPDANSLEAPAFEGFDIIAGPSVSTGHSIQFINGKQTTSYSRTYTYVLMPNVAGKYTIGAASIKVEGKKYSTQPQAIEVIAEKSNAAERTGNSGRKNPESQIGKDDILLRLKISDTELYKGESLRASLVLYTRANIDNLEDLSLPSFDGFWSQELSFDNTPSREEYNGRIYETYKITELLLSPQQSGAITIPSATLTAIARVVVQDNRFDPFFGGGQVYRVPRTLKSDPVTIRVKEFPAGAPATFNGAVGRFKLSSVMPSPEIKSNSADQIEVTISGNGNLKFISAPTISLPESFEQYDTKIVDNIKVSAMDTSGSITYTYPFVARSAGEFIIEPLRFSYFDPATGEYNTLATEPFTIKVLDDGTSANTTAVERYTNYGSTMRQLDRDIRFIHIGKMPQKCASLFMFTPIYWLIVVVIIAIFIVVYVLLNKRIRDNRNIVARRMKHADKVAIQRLRSAEHYMNDGNRHAFYEELLRALWGYISDKFNIPVSNLTKERIREELYRRNVSSALAEEFCEIISSSEEAQYSPSSEGEMSEAYTRAIDVMTKIEGAIKR